MELTTPVFLLPFLKLIFSITYTFSNGKAFIVYYAHFKNAEELSKEFDELDEKVSQLNTRFAKQVAKADATLKRLHKTTSIWMNPCGRKSDNECGEIHALSGPG